MCAECQRDFIAAPQQFMHHRPVLPIAKIYRTSPQPRGKTVCGSRANLHGKKSQFLWCKVCNDRMLRRKLRHLYIIIEQNISGQEDPPFSRLFSVYRKAHSSTATDERK